MAVLRFGRRPRARHLAADWGLALTVAAVLEAALALTGCGQDEARTDDPRTTLPGVRGAGSETGWWATLAVDDDGHAQPVDLSVPPGGARTGGAPAAGQTSPSRLVLAADLLFFETDSAAVGPDGQRLLDEVAAWLADHGPAPVSVVGHTDSTGADAYNLDLGLARAEAVAAGLRERGVPADRLGSVTSEGERSPVDTNDTEAGRAHNRRVELVLPRTT
ncbi:MAG: OmpA family protein [Acidimicrobiales bacterium]